MRAALLLPLLLLACAGRPAEAPPLRVGTSGDYAPFTWRDDAGRRAGFDVEVARAYARERGLRIRWVPVRWTALERDFAAGRFDVVMSGVTQRPERSLAGRFSVPVARAGLVVLAPAETREPFRADGLRMAVNAGGHLERAARRLFPDAHLLPLTPNAAARAALLDGTADVAVTDTLEARGWLAGTTGLRALGPYTRDFKAYWLPAAAAARARDLDAWLLAREADGTLAGLRARHLPEAAREATAAPLPALVAAIAERLALMPRVAEAKRASGAPVRAPAQERAVLDAAVASVRAAARERDVAAPPEAAVRAFFAALIEAAREVQEHTLAGPPGPAVAASELDAALRPALARVSERIARLLVRLPAALSPAEIEAALAGLDAPGVRPATRAHLAHAIGDVH